MAKPKTIIEVLDKLETEGILFEEQNLKFLKLYARDLIDIAKSVSDLTDVVDDGIDSLQSVLRLLNNFEIARHSITNLREFNGNRQDHHSEI